MLNIFCLYLPSDPIQQDHYLAMLRVAIYSCVTRTSLRPVVLHNSRVSPEMLAWMHDKGVQTIEHEVSFADSLRRHFRGYQLEFALGGYMRCDIPQLFPDEERVLYTDADVVFQKDPVEGLNFDMNGFPLGVCQEIGPVPGGYCTSDWMRNSGVILFNNRWFRENPVDFGAFGNSKGWKFDGFEQNAFDQGLLNNLFPTDTYRLPAEFNWRPYQGKNKHQIIVHYHMFKPDTWNHQVTDYLLRTSWISDSTVQSALAFAAKSIRASVHEFRRLNSICEGGLKGSDPACSQPRPISGLLRTFRNACKESVKAVQMIRFIRKYELLDEDWYRNSLRKSQTGLTFVPTVHFAFYGLEYDRAREGFAVWVAYLTVAFFYKVYWIFRASETLCTTLKRSPTYPVEPNATSSIPDIRAIALYLPQYHAVPENDEWWGKGFTEWTNVKKAKPQYEGHYQPHAPHPDLGYYDLKNEEVLEKQAQLAKSHGIEGFCFYYYWFKGKRLLEMPTDRMLATGKPDFPFCFCWANENWTRTWDGGDREILMSQDYCAENNEKIIRDLLPAFRDSRYIRIHGKPLFVVWRPQAIPEFPEVSRLWRKICREQGLGEIYLTGIQSHAYLNQFELGLDAVIQFTPGPTRVTDVQEKIGIAPEERIQGGIYDYNELMLKNTFLPERGMKEFHGICPSWDNTARRADRGVSWINSSPEKYYKWLKAIVSKTRDKHVGDERMIFINAWNEWAEGCYLEPDEKYGYAWLNATKAALSEN